MIEHGYYVTCDWCGEPAGDTGVPVPVPCASMERAIGDAIDREWVYDLETRRLLCPACAECECGSPVPIDAIEQGWTYNPETHRLACPQCSAHPESGVLAKNHLAEGSESSSRPAVDWWIYLDFVGDNTGNAYFARRDCPACRGGGLVPAPTWRHRLGDTDNCECVRSAPRPWVTAAALLTDGHGQVLRDLVRAPVDVETWLPERPLVVRDSASGEEIPTLAGRVALYPTPIGQHPPAPTIDGRGQAASIVRAACAYCDVPLLDGPGEAGVRYLGDSARQVCPAHPRTDRPRPHLAKWPARPQRSAPGLPVDPVERLRLAAAGRRAYAANVPAGHPHRTELADEASIYDMAALIAADADALHLVIPQSLPLDAGRIDPITITVEFSTVARDGENWLVAAYGAWAEAAEGQGVEIAWSSFDFSLLDVDANEDTTVAALRIGAAWYLLCQDGTTVHLVSADPPSEPIE